MAEGTTTANVEKWRKIADSVIAVVILGVVTQGILLWKEVAVLQSEKWTLRDHSEYATSQSKDNAAALRELNQTLSEIKTRLAAFSPGDTTDRLDKISSQLGALTAEVASLKAKVERGTP